MTVTLHKNQYTLEILSRWILLRMGNILTEAVEKKRTFYVQQLFFEGHVVYEIMGRNSPNFMEPEGS